jgi:hypothetical protein
MEIALGILCLILIIVCCVVLAEYHNVSQAEKTVKLNNDEILKQRSLLQEQIDNKQSELDTVTRSIQRDRELLESLHNSKVENLEKIFQEKNEVLQQQYYDRLADYEYQLNELLSQVESLRSTKAATIAAFQKEEAIRNQADAYRLNIPENEIADIKVLRSIQDRLSKPRILSMLIWQTYYQPVAKKTFANILPHKDTCGIYKITSLKTGMCYVGQAISLQKRWSEHCKAGLGIDTPVGNKLYAAMLAEGLYGFTFELLEECKKEELDEKERYYIDVYNSVEFGYNSNRGVGFGK